MRSTLGLALVAFACGVSLLQTCAALPAHPVTLIVAISGLAATLAALWRRCLSPPAVMISCACALALAAGFGYAAWRADQRMAEALPREWEGEDLRVVGIVDDLPAVSERGVRFALAAAEMHVTASAISHQVARLESQLADVQSELADASTKLGEFSPSRTFKFHAGMERNSKGRR